MCSRRYPLSCPWRLAPSKKSPPLTRSYPTCPSAKRPIPSRATSGCYKALEPFGPRSGTFWQPLSDGPAHAPGGLPQVELARRKVLLHLLSGRLDELGVVEDVLDLVGGDEAADVLLLHHVP